MNKSKAMVAGLVATALGLASTAQAQNWQPQQGQREHQHQQQHQSQQRSAPQWQGHRQWQGQRHYAPQYQARAWGGYGGAYAGSHRGGYVAYAHPHHYRAYDWRARHLAAPPYGYGWVEDDSGDVLLMALATGLIANAIVNSAAAPAPYYQAPSYYQPPNYQPYGEGPYPY